MRLLLITALPVLSCYSPEIPSGKFACDKDSDCPAPYLCRPMGNRGSRCVDPGPLPSSTPCSDGVLLSDAVWGCRGAIAAGGASALCQTGWHLCDSKDSGKLAIGAACEGQAGFFASGVPIEHVREASSGGAPGSRPYDIDCDVGFSVDTPHGLLGCGTEDGARRIAGRDGNCPGLSTAVACGAPSRWSCGGEGLSRATYNGKGGGGVLCCSN